MRSTIECQRVRKCAKSLQRGFDQGHQYSHAFPGLPCRAAICGHKCRGSRGVQGNSCSKFFHASFIKWL
eukprot:1159680-Pelagomonas_calceolata.AAC.12